MFCDKCGTQNPENAAFCKKCGSKLPKNPKIPVRTVKAAERTAPPRSQGRRQQLFTTRKTSRTYLIINLFGDLLVNSLFASFCIIKGEELMSTYVYRSEGAALQKLSIFLIIYAALSLLYHVMVSRTYADIFENRIVGTGMQGIQSKSFDLRFDQLNGISTSKGFLNIESGSGVFLVINTPAGNYRVLTTEARAREITDFLGNR